MIKVEKLTKRFGETYAIQGLDFEIGRGEVVGFLGPNGAGKTTTLKILTGYLAPSSGRAWIAGTATDGDDEDYREKVGYLPEGCELYPEMTVFSFLTFAGRIKRLDGQPLLEAIERSISNCGLQSVINQRIGTLSKGFKQRVGIAQAVLNEPDILILDEPTSGLDPNQLGDIRRLIKTYGQEKTVLFSSHLLSEVEAVSDRVLILKDGILVADASPATLRDATSRSDYKLSIHTRDPESALSMLESLEFVESVDVIGNDDQTSSYRLRLVNAEFRSALSRRIHDEGLDIVELSRDESTLENVFRTLTIGESK